MTNDALLKLVPRVQRVTGVAGVLDFRARSHGGKEAVVSGNERINFAQLAGRARSIGNQLKHSNVKFGDRVALFMPNGPDFISAFFAVLGIGAIVVPVNPLLKPDEIKHILEDSEACALVVHETLVDTALASLGQASALNSLFVAATSSDGLKQLPATTMPVEQLCTSMAAETTDWPVTVEPKSDLAVLVYTSGTTGKPKGAMLTHHNLLSVFPSRLDLFDIDERDRCLAALPLCHIYGMTVVMIGTVARGGTLVLIPRFDAKTALETMQRERVTILPAVPAMYSMMLAEIAQGNYDLLSLRVCFSGGAPLSAELLQRIEQSFGVPAVEGYALTETSCVATINPLHGVRKLASVGPAVPGVEMGIFSADGKQLPPGPDNVGEIAVSGPNLMTGYYKQPQATAEVIKEGWFLTGDLGYRDEDGYIFIVGRKKELIIRGGHNVYPREVEDVIMSIPGVREAAVIGVPDEFMGERVKALLVVMNANCGLTEDTVREYCTEHLADFKVPRIVEFVDSLPRNSTGKVLKRLLK